MKLPIRAGRVALLLAFAVLAFASSASAASVSPTFVAGNPTCSDYGYTGLSIDSPNASGTHSDGTLTVTVQQAGAGQPIDSWTSNIGVDMVIVKGGAGSGGTEGSNVYRYDPPQDAYGDTNLVAPNGTGTSHVEFCYDQNSGPPPPPLAPPVCQDTSATTAPGTPVDMSLPCSGSGSNLTCSIVGMPQNGTLGDVNGCVVTYTPNGDACGNDTFTYQSTDSNGTSNVATATITVTPCSESTPSSGDQPSGDQPAQLDAPAQTSAPPSEPSGQFVLGERISGGSAKLLAATGCAGKPFSARVRGANIARVVFTLDGKRLATLYKPNSKGLFALRVNTARYRIGVHRLAAVVTFTASSRTAPRTLRASFQRCANRLIAPRFTG